MTYKQGIHGSPKAVSVFPVHYFNTLESLVIRTYGRPLVVAGLAVLVDVKALLLNAFVNAQAGSLLD